MTGKRFINDIDIGQLIDTKGELSTIDYSDKVDFYELWEFLNKLNDENEQLNQFKKQVFQIIDDSIKIYEDTTTNDEFLQIQLDTKLQTLYNLRKELLK